MYWQTTISLGGFGNAGEMEWQTVRSWQSFTDYFEGAIHVDAVTYCESPDLLLDLFEHEDFQLESMDVIVGNRDEYQSSVTDVNVARRLAALYRQEKLVIRLKNRRVIHSKLYRIVESDDEVTLLAGSANLSRNSWTNQTNSIVAFRTERGSQLDQQFCDWIEDHREYSETVFIADLAEQLAAIDDEDERERRVELWVDNRDTQLTERAEVHADAGDLLAELGDEIDRLASVEDDVEDPDGTVAVEEPEPEDKNGTGSETMTDEAVRSAKTPDYTLTLSTQSLDSDGYAAEFGSELKRHGADVGSNAITTPVDGYANYLQTKYDVPKMWLDDDRTRVHLQHGETHLILTAKQQPDPETLDNCLANIEEYVETVDRWGETNNAEAVKTHMYEGALYRESRQSASGLDPEGECRKLH